MNLSPQFIDKVAEAVLESRNNFGGTDTAFAKTQGIAGPIFSRLKSGERKGIISDSNWIILGRTHNVTLHSSNWKTARTDIYNALEDNLNFCKEFSKAMILVDECGIGKTHCSRHIISRMQNGFHIDCSQSKTKQQFVRALAKIVGVDNQGRCIDVLNNLKYALNVLDKPLVVLDDAGYLDYNAFLVILELWNGTEKSCGWYMMGDDSLEMKIRKGLNSKKIGYKATFSRFSEEFISLIPKPKHDKQDYLAKLIGDVASANTEKKNVNSLVKKCLTKEKTLRHLETLIELAQ